jgi:hypothetical protein
MSGIGLPADGNFKSNLLALNPTYGVTAVANLNSLIVAGNIKERHPICRRISGERQIIMNGLGTFKIKRTTGSKVEESEAGLWHLSIPPGQPNQYRWAQLEDYSNIPRARFAWQPPVRLECSARVSHNPHPGTWGFGFWNDPFSASMKIKGAGFRLPALPNAAWFFYASPESQLSLQANQEACGLLAAVFRSPLIPSWVFIPAYLLSPLLFIHAVSRLARKFLAGIVNDEFTNLEIDPTQWNRYRLEVLKDRVEAYVNGNLAFRSSHVPRGHLGALVWIDNQYAGFSPDGRIQAGLLENGEPAWLEVKDWILTKLD